MPLPLIFAIAATRGLLGVGIGLLISEKIGRKHRRMVGGTLAAVSALSTIPLAIGMFRRARKMKAVDGEPFANVPQSGIDVSEGLRAD
jgi:hypothetical protein